MCHYLYSGTLVFDQTNPQKSKVEAIIKTTDVVTGVPKLDEHLEEKFFFDVAQFPTATFVSNKVEMAGNNTAKVTGMLTLRGVSKPVVLNVILNKSGISPITNNQTVGFSATTELKRSDFGMTTLLPNVGDDVKINIEAEANKAE